MVVEKVNLASDAAPNYRVNVTHFGTYKRGDIVPAFLVKQACTGGDESSLVEAGHITPTDAAINVAIVAPRADATNRESVAQRDVVGALNRTRDEAAKQEAAAKHFEARFNDADRAKTALSTELTQKVAQLDGYRIENSKLKQEVVDAAKARQTAEQNADGAVKNAKAAADELAEAKAQIAHLQVELAEAQKLAAAKPDDDGPKTDVLPKGESAVPPPVSPARGQKPKP